MLFLHATLIVLATVLARLALLVGGTASSSDNIGSIRITEAQRRQRWLGFAVENSVIAGTYAYPPFVYWLVSKCPRAWWSRARYFLNYAADAATALLVWAGIRYGFPTVSPTAALMAACAVAFNPLLLPTVEHARISAPNARSLGLFFNTLWIGVLVVLASGPDSSTFALALALLVPLSWVIILTSQFGMQTMVGLTVLMALFTASPWALLALVGAAVLGWMVPGLGVREVLRHKFAHWRWYRGVQKTIVNAVSGRARPWSARVSAFWDIARHPVRNGQALGQMLQQSGWWKMLAGAAPFGLAVAVALLDGGSPAPAGTPSIRALALVCLAAATLFFLTTQPRLVFLGEAERYVEHALPAFAVLTVALLAHDDAMATSAMTAAFLLSLTIVLAQVAHRQWPQVQGLLRYPELGYHEERAMLRLLVELGRPVRVASVPVKTTFLLHDLLLDEALAGSERVQFYFQHVLQPDDDRFAYLRDDTTDGYTYLTDDLPALVRKYGITALVVDTLMLDDATNHAPILSVLRQRTPMHRGRFALFSLHDLHSKPTPGSNSTLAATVPDPMTAAAPRRKSARERALELEARTGAAVQASPAPTIAETRGPAPEVFPQPTPSPVAPHAMTTVASASPMPSQGRRPRILAIVDVPNWIFARHAGVLQHGLASEFEITVQCRNEAVDESAFDLIYPLEFDLVRPEIITQPWKWVTGIRSHISWDYCTAEQLSHYLSACFQRTHVVSRRLEGLLASTLPSLDYVTHGFDAGRFAPVPRRGTQGTLRLGWAGNRLSPAKGYEQFVEPLGALPGVELVICGFADHHYTPDEMPAFYAGIDAYICTSATEGNNNALLEAAGMGTAIVTTRTGTVSEYLRDGESALIVPRTPAAFRSAVERLRDDLALRHRLGETASGAVHPAWSWAARLPEYRAFFYRALADVAAAEGRMRGLRDTRVARGLPAWPALPLNPRNFDILTAVTLVQQAMAEGDVTTARQTLDLLVERDPSNPTWGMVLAEMPAIV